MWFSHFDSPQDYLAYYATLKAKEKEYDHLTVLSGIHSLRAASESDIKTIFSATTGDFHIHIAEQLKEVNDCVTHTGMRPVEYLLDKLDNHQRLQLVHATHLCEKEIEFFTKVDIVKMSPFLLLIKYSSCRQLLFRPKSCSLSSRRSCFLQCRP